MLAFGPALRRRVLISFCGPHDNCPKVRPPLLFSKDNADYFLQVMDKALAALYSPRLSLESRKHHLAPHECDLRLQRQILGTEVVAAQ